MSQLAPPPAPPPPAQQQPPPGKAKHWTEKISRSGYFFGAVLLHLVVFLMVATLVIFPPFHPPTDDFQKTYVPATPPPPPPPPSEPNVTMPTHTVSTPTTVITAPTATPTFSVPMPDLSPETTPVDVTQKMMTTVKSAPTSISSARLAKIMTTEKAWGRSRENIEESGGDPRNVTAKFPVFLAKYADGDWYCNVQLVEGKIKYGSLPNLVAKMNEWSHNHITGGVVPEPLDIGGPELLDKKPPFIFFTGHKDFHLTDQEVKNLSDYLQIGGAIWGDNTLAGYGSRFDVAFRREMKRVVPDLDKNFEPLDASAGEVYTKIFPRGWFPTENVPLGMNYYKEPLEHLDIDGKLAILYTPNDYSDMYSMCILPGDTEMMGDRIPLHWTGLQLFTNGIFLHNRDLFFRNFQLPACLACQHLGMNIIGYMLVRFDEELLLAPP
jgi:hypothetical protein